MERVAHGKRLDVVVERNADSLLLLARQIERLDELLLLVEALRRDDGRLLRLFNYLQISQLAEYLDKLLHDGRTLLAGLDTLAGRHLEQLKQRTNDDSIADQGEQTSMGNTAREYLSTTPTVDGYLGTNAS